MSLGDTVRNLISSKINDPINSQKEKVKVIIQ